MRARGYIRVSTDEQAKNGDSIPSQKRILEAFAVVKGFDDFVIYVDDGYSGKNLNRPKIQQLLEECKTGEIDAVIVWKLDRLSRSLRDTLAIVEDIFTPNNVALISTTESIDSSTPSGRAMMSILATFAQFEREQDSDRVIMVNKQLAKDCRYLGGPVPLGYKIVNKHYVIDEETAPIVRKIFEMYLAHMGYTQILRYINDECGLRTITGRPYSKVSLNYILGNEKYVGTYIHNRLAAADVRGKRSSTKLKPESQIIRVPGGIPAIITQATWDAACRLREENRRFNGRYSDRTQFLLSGLCRCGICGSALLVDVAGKDRNGTQQRYYVCRNKCITAARKEKLEAAALDALAYLAIDEDLMIRACEVANDLYADRQAVDSASISVLETRSTQINKRRANITDFISNAGKTAPAALVEELEALDQEQQQLLKQIDTLRNPSRPYEPKRLIAALNAVKDAKKLPPEQQKMLLQAAVRGVIVQEDEYKFILTGDGSMELRGVEPLSESSQAEPSPSAVCGSDFPRAHAHRQEWARGSFILRTHGKA